MYMKSFKDVAYKVLKDSGKPLHSKEITKIALKEGLLNTAGKTPEATMKSAIIVDINKKGKDSRFKKHSPSTFCVNEDFSNSEYSKSKKDEDSYKISKSVTTQQKGDIAEARVAELITLYGEIPLSCYKPVSDDEGIDLIVKEKRNFKKTMYIQIKSSFGNDPTKAFKQKIKQSSIVENYSMAIVFCFFDTEKGDLGDALWFIPAPDFLKRAHHSKGGKEVAFVAGRTKKESNNWNDYMIDKRDLGNAITKQMNRL